MYSVELVGYDKNGLPRTVGFWWDDDENVKEKIITTAFRLYDKFKFYKIEKRLVGYL